jgi:hypothetical protein
MMKALNSLSMGSSFPNQGSYEFCGLVYHTARCFSMQSTAAAAPCSAWMRRD